MTTIGLIDITSSIIKRSYLAPEMPAPSKNAPPSPVDNKTESPQESLENAIGVLSLVSFGTPQSSQVLNALGLKDREDPQTLIKLANEIIQYRKNGGPVLFENGRIFLSKDIFEDLLNSVKDPSQFPEQKVVVIKKPVSAAIVHESLDIKKAFELLSSIIDPKGTKYIPDSVQFEDNKKNRKILEDTLKKFWDDYVGGAPLAVKSQQYSYSIDPKMIIGNTINAEASEKLEDIYKKQHA